MMPITLHGIASIWCDRDFGGLYAQLDMQAVVSTAFMTAVLPSCAVNGKEHSMNNTALAISITLGLSVVGATGDCLLKKASEYDKPLLSLWFISGLIVYSSTAFGWVFALRHLKLATVGVIYSLAMILLLAIMGTVLFKQSLSLREWSGIVLALVSLGLLTRFA